MLALLRLPTGCEWAHPYRNADRVCALAFSADGKTLPTTSTLAGYTPATSKYVASIGVGAAGKITVKTQNTGCATQPEFLLTPTVDAGKVSWKCEATAGDSCAPASCR